MPTLISGRNIVVVGQQPWDTPIGSNCKDIALEFSKHNRVLYVNAPLDRNTLLRQRRTPVVQQRLRVINGQEPAVQVVADNLWVLTPAVILESINWLPAALHTWFNKRNNRRFAGAIRRAMQELQFERFVLFNDNDIFRSFYLPELLQPEVSVYYSRDYMVSVDYWRKHGLRLEPQLIAKSDVCVANSSYLAAYCQQFNNHSFDVGQGCDAALHTDAPVSDMPPELANIPRPVIGYVGALLSTRLSLEVLRHISQQRPDWSIVLVGPEDDTFKASDLHGRANVHFLGPRPPETLAPYIQHFDVCLNPQAVNDMTRGNYPRKVDEYLALGKPVVATRTETMGLFENHTYLAKTAQDYVALIAQALREDGPVRQQQRRAFAATHTWKNSVDRIYEAIAAHRSGHRSPATYIPRPAVTARPQVLHPQPAAQ
jgi:glycosyltransferase involved in cell wall biosynthesis